MTKFTKLEKVAIGGLGTVTVASVVSTVVCWAYLFIKYDM